MLDDPHVWKPECNGWNLSDGKYAINWFSRRQVPEAACSQIDDEVLPNMMIKKLPTAMSQTVIQMIKGQFKFNISISVYKVVTISSLTFP